MYRSRTLLLGLILVFALPVFLHAGPPLPSFSFCHPTGGPIAHVGTDTLFTTTSNTSPIAITLAQQPAAGDTLVIAISHLPVNFGAFPTTAISGAGISTYIRVALDTVINDSEVWVGANASGTGGTSLSLATGGFHSDQVMVAVAEFKNLTATVDVQSNNSGTATTIATPSVTTTNANDLIAASTAYNAITTLTGVGYTQFGSTPANDATALTIGAAYTITSATGAQSTSWTGADGTHGWDTTIGALKAAAGTTCGNPAPGGGTNKTRDPALWPFADTSPWNYPVGSSASLASIGTGTGTIINGMYIQPASYAFGIWIAATTDPLYTLNNTGGNWYGFSTNTTTRHVPSGAHAPTGSDGPMAVVSPDHLTSVEMYQATLTGSTWSFSNGTLDVDLKGPGCNPYVNMGIYLNSGDEATPVPSSNPPSGTPFAPGYADTMGCAYLAGPIRIGELGSTIPHSLRLIMDANNLNGNLYGGNGFTWPAVARDNPVTVPYGTTGNLAMGTLLALPPSFNVSGLATLQGQAVARAFMNYGGYISSSSLGGVGSNNIAIQIDLSASGEVPVGGAFAADLNTIASNLRVVTNSNHNGSAPVNGIKLDGGDGTLLAPLAPTFDR